jgi:putative glutamine amidotransferase
VKRREPFIGITCDVSVRKRRGERRCDLVCDYRYPEAVKRAGGYPILLPIAYRSEIVSRYLDRVSGLVIVGGDDVDPKLYGEKRRLGTGTVYGPRLYFERKLYREARRRRLPILGICYGMQLINVLEGGTLFQDIRRDAKSLLDHRDRRMPYHPVSIAPRSRLGRTLGQKTVKVHSDHHQAVSRVAPGFKPVAFAPDGVVEAIESDHKEILAVQWHPERAPAHRDTRQLFRWFVSLAHAHEARYHRARRRKTKRRRA